MKLKLLFSEKRGKHKFSVCSNSGRHCEKKGVCLKDRTNNSKHCMLAYVRESHKQKINKLIKKKSFSK